MQALPTGTQQQQPSRLGRQAGQAGGATLPQFTLGGDDTL
jgi:hypothetical protein